MNVPQGPEIQVWQPSRSVGESFLWTSGREKHIIRDPGSTLDECYEMTLNRHTDRLGDRSIVLTDLLLYEIDQLTSRGLYKWARSSTGIREQGQLASWWYLQMDARSWARRSRLRCTAWIMATCGPPSTGNDETIRTVCERKACLFPTIHS